MKISTTTWSADAKVDHYPKLEHDIETDVVVVGGGITGLLTAYLLAEVGKNVVVLEANKIGLGASAYTTAFITQAVDLGLVEMESLLGPERTLALWEAGGTGIDLLEDIVRKEKIECEFKRCSEYLYVSTPGDLDWLKDEQEAARRLGIKTSLRPTKTLPFANLGALEIPQQAKFHPAKFMSALAARCHELGVKIFESSRVVELSGTSTLIAKTATASVTADDVIVATAEPFNRPKFLKSKQAKYKSYVLEAEIPKDLLPEAMFIDSANPYHYIRVDAGDKFDRLIMGGCDHRRDLPVGEVRSLARLEGYLPSLLGGAKYRIVERWSGPLVESVDGLPYIGEYEPHQYVATGFSGNGMTYAAIAATIFRDQIMGQPNAWIKLYDPKRKQPPKLLLANAKHYLGLLVGGAIKTTLGFKK